MAEISVIIPIYNVEKYLVKCVDSVIAQTYKDLEIILVDDGSLDNCGKICDEYAISDPRIKVIHKKNGGLSDARNAGIEIQTSKYIGFVDSDDYIDPDMYETLYNLIKKEEADMAYCAFYDVYESEIIKKPGGKIFVGDRAEGIKLYLDWKITPSACLKLYKKELFDSIRFPVGRLTEDVFIVVKLLLKSNKVVVTTDPKYYYVHRANSIMTKPFTPRDMDYIEASLNNVKLISDVYPEYKAGAEIRCCYAAFFILDRMAHSETLYKKERKEITKLLRSHFLQIMKNSMFSKGRKFTMVLLMINVTLYNLVSREFYRRKRIINE